MRNWYHCLSRQLQIFLSQYDKNFAYTISFNVSEEEAWKTQYRKIWNEAELQLFEKMRTESIKKDDRYVNGKLNTWKECTKTNFYGQGVPYNIHYDTTAVLIIDSVYKQTKNYHPRYMLKSANTLMQKTNTAACWVIIMMDFFRYEKVKNIFLTCMGYKTNNKWLRHYCESV